MAEEKKHHHLFHHNKDDEESSAAYSVEGTHDYKEDEKKHKKDEHLGEVGAVAAGLFAEHEKHEEKKDPENAHRHKLEEEIAATAAVGAGGYAFHEHHDKKEDEKAQDTKKHHHLF
ncbi:unnamed protein product [Lactuca virosa]|uniref:Uncharacterized protein n=1 Tax=Lactuca virosa TaxID=75947 RepID=A0AAU9P843_9ASTR|nr:unnamed protein product [Lactuca virosa]